MLASRDGINAGVLGVVVTVLEQVAAIRVAGEIPVVEELKDVGRLVLRVEVTNVERGDVRDLQPVGQALRTPLHAETLLEQLCVARAHVGDVGELVVVLILKIHVVLEDQVRVRVVDELGEQDVVVTVVHALEQDVAAAEFGRAHTGHEGQGTARGGVGGGAGFGAGRDRAVGAEIVVVNQARVVELLAAGHAVAIGVDQAEVGRTGLVGAVVDHLLGDAIPAGYAGALVVLIVATDLETQGVG